MISRQLCGNAHPKVACDTGVDGGVGRAATEAETWATSTVFVWSVDVAEVAEDHDEQLNKQAICSVPRLYSGLLLMNAQE